MSRKALVRGIQLVVLLTLATFAYLLATGVEREQASLGVALATARPGYLLVAAALALQEGVCGGLRVWVLSRVLARGIAPRLGIVSEFVLMFCAGVTPGQAGAAPSQIAVLMHGGMRFADAATAELLTASCTILFFLSSALTVALMRSAGLLVVEGGAELDLLLLVSVGMFGSAFVALALCAAYPPLLKGVIRAGAALLAGPSRALYRALSRVRPLAAFAEKRLASPGALSAGLLRTVDDFHAGFRVYLRRGKLAYLSALGLTFGFFCSRFAAAYFILLGLGIPTEPRTFVAVGPPIVQIVLVQALLNFALYLSPTPGASGIAEAGSSTLMSPWVTGPYELPYLVLWRVLTLFLCMFVGGLYVFRYLGTDVLEERVKDVEAQKRAREEARAGGAAAAGTTWDEGRE
jgi:uncharacterized membrane protein YbhN (UPF0104 family)